MLSGLVQHQSRCWGEGVLLDEINIDNLWTLIKQTILPNVGCPHPIR